MYVERPGHERRRNLGAILQEAHERVRRTILGAIALREERGAPLADDPDGEDVLEDPGEYVPAPDRDALSVVLRVVPPSVWDEYQTRLEAAREAVGGIGPARETAEGRDDFRSAWAFLLSEALVSVDGFEDDAGAYSVTGADFDALSAAGIVVPLVSACMDFQRLTAEERKNCGMSRSASVGDATNAQPTSALSEAATAAPRTQTGMTRVPRGSESATRGSIEPSSSTEPLTVM